jgi:hypothetical protein
MARYSKRKYSLQVAALMAIYVVLVLFVWPLARTASGLPTRFMLAVLPAIPVVLVIVLMARKVLRSDELEQRMHMVALSIGTGVVGATSIMGGFLAAARVWRVDGAILLWVFPLLALVYGLSRNWLKWRYTGSLSWRDWMC